MSLIVGNELTVIVIYILTYKFSASNAFCETGCIHTFSLIKYSFRNNAITPITHLYLRLQANAQYIDNLRYMKWMYEV